MWWPKVRRVGLASDRLFLAPAAVRRGGACREIPVATAGDGPAWQPAVQALVAALRQDGQRGARLHVILGGDYVRWKLLDIPPGVKTATEREAFAAFSFRSTYGEVEMPWSVQVAAQPAGWPTPACAVDAGLLAALTHACGEAGVRLASLTPYFAAAFDHWRHRLNSETAWFCLREPQTLTLGLAAAGRWVGLQSRACADDWRDVLALMQAQLAIPAGLAGRPAAFHLVNRADAQDQRSATTGEPLVLAPPTHWPEPAVRCRMAYGI